MKKLIGFALIAIGLLFCGCEKVIDVQLNTAPPRLVIDAAIQWTKGTTGNNQRIKLSTTTSYFSTTIPPVSGATVFIMDSNSSVFDFIENTETGEYFCGNFTPVLNGVYTLTVIYKNQTYTATEILKRAPAIDFIEQKNDGGFTGKDKEIKAFFTDDAATEDYYLFKFRPSTSAFPAYNVAADKFFQGNQIFSIYTSKDLKSGDHLEINSFGVSERYYNYINILISIAGTSSGSPFQSPPSTVRGNVINATNAANYPLGFFSLSESDYKDYIVQ